MNKKLTTWEREGWMGVRHRNALRCLADELKARRGPTLLVVAKPGAAGRDLSPLAPLDARDSEATHNTSASEPEISTSALAVAALHALKPLYPPHGVSAQRRRLTLCSAPESETSMLAVAGARIIKPLHGLARTVGTQRRRSSNLLRVAVRHPLSRPAPATAKQHIPRPHPSPRSAHSPPPQRAAPRRCTDQPRGVGAQHCPLIASSSCGLLLLSKPSTLTSVPYPGCLQ
ncbi:hypothetical protein B0H14DRAFT_3861630 [Mycena olivaceomarginata]|nr:hypothetical protein B0H14DRAFT_3861630 [Mycena olivaceomarginata]